MAMRRRHSEVCLDQAVLTSGGPQVKRRRIPVPFRHGFEYEGRRYRSLTVIAERITGAHWSGPRFFGLGKRARPS